MRTVLCLLLFLANHHMSGQGSKQITSRKIKSVYTTLSELKKGTIVKKSTLYTYDHKGRLLLQKEFDQDSICTQIDTYEYNRKGDLTKHITKDNENGNAVEQIEIQYDKWGRDTLKTEIHDGDLKQTTKYLYNTMDEKTEELTYDKSGSLVRKSTFTYDKRGMLLTKKTFNSAGDLIFEKTNTYTY